MWKVNVPAKIRALIEFLCTISFIYLHKYMDTKRKHENQKLISVLLPFSRHNTRRSRCCTELMDARWLCGGSVGLWLNGSRALGGSEGLRRGPSRPRCVLIWDERRLLICPSARTSYSSADVFLYLQETDSYIHLWSQVRYKIMKKMESILMKRGLSKHNSLDFSGKESKGNMHILQLNEMCLNVYCKKKGGIMCTNWIWALDLKVWIYLQAYIWGCL